jgi:FMN phosphatase YigB (HAD superfamily)
MRISFDLDDTIACEPAVPTEQCAPWWRRWRYSEGVRRGTQALMKELVVRRCQLWIYTTSYRPPRYLRGWFRSFGVPVEGVVNQDRHEQVIKTHTFPGHAPSKYPPAFGIDLHIDDSEGVAMEGRQFGFRVLVVSPYDPDWAARVLAAVDAHGRGRTAG